MNLRLVAWNLAVAAGAALTLQAHPGHAPFSEGTKHFVTSPSHFGPVLVFGALLCGAAQFLNRRAERNFVRAIAVLVTLVAVLS
jgi:hypothetical protein